MSPTQPDSPDGNLREGRDLVSDQRGAIILISVFMCALLAGCLWHLIDIGEAAYYRERLDAGADAAAYTSAVYHARGMNVVAMLNMVIASLIATVIFAKGLDYVMGVAYYTSRFICAANNGNDPSCQIARDSAANTQQLKAMIDKAESTVDSIVPGLSKAQRDIAQTTPWVGSMESAKTAQKYDPSVKLGAAVSSSMAPEGQRLGLPIMDEPYKDTCWHGGRMEPTIVTSALPQKYAPYVEQGNVKEVAARLPMNYCGPTTPPITKKDLELVQNIPGKHPTEADIQRTMAQQNIPSVHPEEDLQKDKNPQDKTGKKLIDGAVNGNEAFQVYSVLESAKGHAPGAGDVATIANLPSTTQKIDPKELERYGMAQAEFYYDQTAQSDDGDQCGTTPERSCGLSWSQYKDNVLWNMRWRARLRLYRMPKNSSLSQNVLEDGVPPAPFDAKEFSSASFDPVNADIKKQVPQSIVDQRQSFNKLLLGK